MLNDIYNKYQINPFIQEIFQILDLNQEQIEQILKDKKFPLVSKDLDIIVNRIFKAIALKEKVVIVGDYDADGIMATTILLKALKRLKVDVGFYIPNRLTEGYGINKTIVENVKTKGYSLIITVDNGVVAYDALDLAKSLDVEVIVIDHHTLDETLNYEFDYLLHPKYLSEGYQDLAGAGLALILAEKLLKGVDVGEFYVYAMVATIADMVSVFGFNRNIIKNGLYVLNKFGNVYIDNLIHYRNKKVDQQTISFQVVPKLNTFGRLADVVNVNNIVRYFMLSSKTEITNVAKDITKLNQERINLTRDTYQNSNGVKKLGSLNVVVDESIHEGISGLIAGRYLNKLNEPVLVLTKNGEYYKGSGRSPIGYDIFALLANLDHCFTAFGGHKQACGLSFHETQLDEVLTLISKYSKEITYQQIELPYLELDISKLSIEVVEAFEDLAPFGVDFIKPQIKIKAEIKQDPLILKEKYLKWSLNDKLDLLAFDSNLDIEYYQKQREIKAFVDMSINEFLNNKKINLIIDKFID